MAGDLAQGVVESRLDGAFGASDDFSDFGDGQFFLVSQHKTLVMRRAQLADTGAKVLFKKLTVNSFRQIIFPNFFFFKCQFSRALSAVFVFTQGGSQGVNPGLELEIRVEKMWLFDDFEKEDTRTTRSQKSDVIFG